jgi:hypothetical protein
MLFVVLALTLSTVAQALGNHASGVASRQNGRSRKFRERQLLEAVINTDDGGSRLFGCH